ncbi:hypothetical protein [Paracoccus mutanolyticus]|nr:hypothetical protein [Paracoccus mutanolyticus]
MITRDRHPAHALVALGFVLLIRSANVVNFAQGEFSIGLGAPASACPI